MEQDNKMRGLVRGAQMTPEDLRQYFKQKQQEQAPVQEGLNEQEAARFQNAMNQIKPSLPPPQINPEEQYVNQMPKNESDSLQGEFDKGISTEDLAKLKALRQMRMGR